MLINMLYICKFEEKDFVDNIFWLFEIDDLMHSGKK